MSSHHFIVIIIFINLVVIFSKLHRTTFLRWSLIIYRIFKVQHSIALSGVLKVVHPVNHEKTRIATCKLTTT